MAIIQVTPEMLTQKASEVRNIRSQHDEAMSKLTSLVTNLNEIWKGTAQDAFKEFSEMVENYAKLKDKAAKELEETDRRLKAEMDSFG